MILIDKIVLKTFDNRKLKYYKNLGYDISGEKFEIYIKDLTSGSRIIVPVKCDYCNIEVNITYKEYFRNISKCNKYACSVKCGFIKYKETSLEKYGVDHPWKLKEIRDKSKETSLEKYGTEYPIQSEEVKNKAKETLMENYGVDCPFKSDIIKDKSKETSLEKYGTEYPIQSEEIKNKARKTLIENYNLNGEVIQNKRRVNCILKYGVDHSSKLDNVKTKSKLTNLERYGVDNPMKLDLFKEKLKLTNLERYGVEYSLLSDDVNKKRLDTLIKNYGVDNPFKSKEIRDIVKKINLEKYGEEYYMNSDNFKLKSKLSLMEKYGVTNISLNENYRKENFEIAKHPNYIKYLDNFNSLFKCDQDKEHEFIINYDNFQKRNLYNTPLCTNCFPIGDFISIKEIELLNYISDIYNDEILPGYRDGLEIDIYLPNLNIGFEFNGLYWHSDLFKEKNYHLNKLNNFKSKGIDIFTIWEDDWDFKKEIIKNKIKDLLNLNIKINSEDCIIKVILNDYFLLENHLEGNDNSLVKLGLYYKEELVSMITFSNIDNDKLMLKNEWIILSICSKLNYDVIYGYNKLLNYFIDIYNPIRIISYNDNSWYNNFYNKFGFKLIDILPVDYMYHINNKRIGKLGILDVYNKIWDCGKIKFELILNS